MWVRRALIAWIRCKNAREVPGGQNRQGKTPVLYTRAAFSLEKSKRISFFFPPLLPRRSNIQKNKKVILFGLHPQGAH
jgi:hypothetical protein